MAIYNRILGGGAKKDYKEMVKDGRLPVFLNNLNLKEIKDVMERAKSLSHREGYRLGSEKHEIVRFIADSAAKLIPIRERKLKAFTEGHTTQRHFNIQKKLEKERRGFVDFNVTPSEVASLKRQDKVLKAELKPKVDIDMMMSRGEIRPRMGPQVPVSLATFTQEVMRGPPKAGKKPLAIEQPEEKRFAIEGGKTTIQDEPEEIFSTPKETKAKPPRRTIFAPRTRPESEGVLTERSETPSEEEGSAIDLSGFMGGGEEQTEEVPVPDVMTDQSKLQEDPDLETYKLPPSNIDETNPHVPRGIPTERESEIYMDPAPPRRGRGRRAGGTTMPAVGGRQSGVRDYEEPQYGVRLEQVSTSPRTRQVEKRADPRSRPFGGEEHKEEDVAVRLERMRRRRAREKERAEKEKESADKEYWDDQASGLGHAISLPSPARGKPRRDSAGKLIDVSQERPPRLTGGGDDPGDDPSESEHQTAGGRSRARSGFGLGRGGVGGLGRRGRTIGPKYIRREDLANLLKLHGKDLIAEFKKEKVVPPVAAVQVKSLPEKHYMPSVTSATGMVPSTQSQKEPGIVIKQTVKQTVRGPVAKKRKKDELGKLRKEYAKIKKSVRARLMKSRKLESKGKSAKDKKVLMAKYKELLRRFVSTKGMSFSELQKVISRAQCIKW